MHYNCNAFINTPAFGFQTRPNVSRCNDQRPPSSLELSKVLSLQSIQHKIYGACSFQMRTYVFMSQQSMVIQFYYPGNLEPVAAISLRLVSEDAFAEDGSVDGMLFFLCLYKLQFIVLSPNLLHNKSILWRPRHIVEITGSSSLVRIYSKRI
jgi:hypothetical protein